MDKWASVRAKGRMRFVVTRGLIIGLSIFTVWLGINLFEIYFSDVKQAIYSQNPSQFIGRCAIWLAVQLLLGGAVSWNMWEGKEKKWASLSQEKQGRRTQ